MLSNDHPLKLVYDALAGCIRALDAFGAPYMMIGAVAACLHSEARATDDVDASVWFPDDERLQDLIACFAEEDVRLIGNIPLETICRASLLRMIHAPSGTVVDVALAATPFEAQAIEHARRENFGGLSLPLPRAEDLAVMKAFANRLQDHADIEKILHFHPSLDLRHVRKWLRQLAQASDSPDLVDSLDRTISEARKRSGMFRRRLASNKKNLTRQQKNISRKQK